MTSAPVPAGQPSSYGASSSNRSGVILAICIGVRLTTLAVVLVLTALNRAGVDATFLTKMQNSPYGSHNNTDAELIQMAHNVCGAFDEGRTVKQIADSFWGMTTQQKGWLIGAGVAVYCPEHQNTMIGEINAYNGY